MKLALCLFKYFPYGGMQRDFYQIAKECIRRGHHVDIYTSHWDDEAEPTLPVCIIPAHGLFNHTLNKSFVTQLQPYLHKGQYDLIVGFNKMPYLDIYFAADTCYQAKNRLQYSSWYRFTPRYKHFVSYEQAVFGVESNTEVLLLSAKQQIEFVRYYQTPSKRFHLLPPGIDKSRVAPPNSWGIRQHVRAEYGIKDQDFLLLMVGSGFKTKGLDRILVALHALPLELKERSHLFVIGKDHPQLFMREAIKLNIDKQITFLGGRKDVPQFLIAADLLLHPAYDENTGTVLLEAMVSGLPVLTVDICGYANYVQQADAGVVLASPFCQEIFNNQVGEMLLSPVRDQWRKNGIAFAQNQEIYDMHARAVNVIETLAPQFKKNALGNKKIKKQWGIHWLFHEVKKYFITDKNAFNQIMSLQGEVYRELEGRRTQRITLGGKKYFIKQHFGVGWKEIIKNLLQLRLPILSAKNEWLAIQYLQTLGIVTPVCVGYGCRGFNPARLKSFIMTNELTDIVSLEDYCKAWKSEPPPFKIKQILIKKLAHISRVLHDNGVNHRDFYLCHFLLDESFISLSENAKNSQTPMSPKIYLIDLHRAQIRLVTPKRWIIKDLAGLYFSSKDIGLTFRDLLRFIREYRQQTLRDIIIRESVFWQRVKNRGDKTYQAHQFD